MKLHEIKPSKTRVIIHKSNEILKSSLDFIKHRSYTSK